MYILEEIKAKLIRICELIALKKPSNRSKIITNKIKRNNNNRKQTKLNRFGFPKDIHKNESNKRK